MNELTYSTIGFALYLLAKKDSSIGLLIVPSRPKTLCCVCVCVCFQGWRLACVNYGGLFWGGSCLQLRGEQGMGGCGAAGWLAGAFIVALESEVGLLLLRVRRHFPACRRNGHPFLDDSSAALPFVTAYDT